MQQFDVAGGKLECDGPHVIFCLTVFVYMKHSGTCNFTSLPFWVCFAIGSASFIEHSVALMPKMQLYSFKRTNLESALFGMTLITAKSLHVHTFPHSPGKQLPLYLRSLSALTPSWKKSWWGTLSTANFASSIDCFAIHTVHLVGLWSASFYFLLENVLLVVADSGRHWAIRHAQVHKPGRMLHQEHVH